MPTTDEAPTLPAPLTKGFAELAVQHGVTVDAAPTVGQQVAVYRRERGVSQAALATAAGIRQATISDLESGVSGVGVRLGMLHALAVALGQPLHVLPGATP